MPVPSLLVVNVSLYSMHCSPYRIDPQIFSYELQSLGPMERLCPVCCGRWHVFSFLHLSRLFLSRACRGSLLMGSVLDVQFHKHHEM